MIYPHAIKFLNEATFLNCLEVWPYRLAGPPTDEHVALINWHKLRLAHPDITETQKSESLKWLHSFGYYEWITERGKDAPIRKGKAKAKIPQRHKRRA